MNSPNPKPSLLIMCAAAQLVLGVSFWGLRGHASTAALGVCALAAAMMPLVRTRARVVEGLLPAPGTTEDDGVLWEAEVLGFPGGPAIFRITEVIGDTKGTLGQAADDWLEGSRFWPDHIVVEDRERVLKACHLAIELGQENLRLEYRVLNAQRQPLWIEDSVHVLRAWGGVPHKLRGRMVNVTEQKRGAEILRQSQKMEEVGRLVGGVVHDFNNLLTVIGGHADLVLMSMDPTDPRRSSMEEIKKAGDRATALARQLLALSRRHTLSLELLDLGAVVGNLGKVLRRLISEDIELVTLPQAGLGHVLVDTGEIEQVIINLVVNARDAMPTGGRLVIETGGCDIDQPSAAGQIPSGRYITLTVTDTGCGMDTATVQEIVRERLTAVVGARLGSGTILLVEDEDNVRVMVRQLLCSYGYQVLEAASSEEALRLMERRTVPVDLLVTDIVMPRMNGHQLGEKLMRRCPALKVLYMSGYSREDMVQHAVLEPEAPYIQKPFTPQTMAASVRKVLDAELEPHPVACERELCLVQAPSTRRN